MPAPPVTLRVHTGYNLAGQMAPLVLALLTIPTYLDAIGEARYGVLAIAWLLIGYFALFDLGLGSAAAQRLASLAQAAPARRAEVFWAALSTNLMLSLPAALLAWLATQLVVRALVLEANLRAELLAALPWVVLTVPVVTVCSILTGALQARERFRELSFAAVVGAFGLQGLPLLTALYISPRLDHLLQAVLLGRLLTMGFLAVCCRHHVTAGHRPTWRRETVRDLLGFGGWASVTAVVGPMMVVLDRFAIGAVLGARAVSHYTIPFQLAERSTVLAGALSYALLPRMARAGGPGEREVLARGALALLAVVMSPLVALAMVLVGPFLAWWVNAELAAASTVVAQVLLAGFWINSMAFVPYTMLQAAGRPDLVAKCHLAELLPYLAMLYLGLRHGALVGAAAAFAVRAAADFLLLSAVGGLLPRASTLLLPAAGLLCILAGGGGPVAWVACAVLLTWSALHARTAYRFAMS